MRKYSENGAISTPVAKKQSLELTRWQLWVNDHGVPITEFLLEPFIVKGTTNLWAGGYGWGKSTLATSVAIHLAAMVVTDEAQNPLAVEGKDEWCGMQLTKPDGMVLYVTEETERDGSMRWVRMMNAYQLNFHQRMVVQGGIAAVSFSTLRKHFGRNVVKGLVDVTLDNSAGLVIVDTFGHLIGDNVNDYHVITRAYEGLQPIIEAGATLLLIDHTAKQYYHENEGQQEGLTPIGSGQKLGQARHVTTIRYLERVDTKDPALRRVAVRMEITKSNHTETGITRDVDLVFDRSIEAQWVEPASLRGIDGEIVELLKARGAMRRKDIVDELNAPNRTVARRLAALVREGILLSPDYGVYAIKGATTGGVNR